MSLVLRLFIALTALYLLVTVLRDLVHRKLTEMQSLFWVVLAAAMLILALIPDGVFLVAKMFRVDYAPAIIFALAVVAIMFGMYHSYRAISQLLRKVNELSIQVSLLNHELELAKGKKTAAAEGEGAQAS